MRPQILLSAIILGFGASLIFFSRDQTPHYLLGHLLALLNSGVGISGLDRPPWAALVEAASILAVGGTTLYALSTRRRRTAIVLFIVGAFAIWGASGFFYASEGLLIDPIYPTAILIVAIAAYRIIRSARDELLRRQVRSAFGNQISARRAERIAAMDGQSYADAQRRTVTVLSCRILDIRAFYAAFEAEPKKLIGIFKELHRVAREAVLNHDGTVDRYAGDRLTAFWNAPLEDPEHARHGCLSAYEIVEKVDALNRRIREVISPTGAPPYPNLAVGIGIETGPAYLGALGTGQRIGYAAMGETVDQAARLQRQAANYGTAIVVGQETRRFVTDLPLLELDRVVLKGQKESTKIYGLLEPHLIPSENAYQAHQLIHNAMLYAYRQKDWQEASNYLERCHGFSDALETLYAIYASRIEYYGSAPPGSTWDGSIVSAGG